MTRKGKVQGTTFTHQVPDLGWEEADQLAASSGPGSQALPSCHLWGSQAPKPIGPQDSGCPNWGGGEPGPTDCDPGQLPLLLCCRDRDGEKARCCLKAWTKASEWLCRGLWSPIGHSSQPVPWASQLNPSQSSGNRLEGLREKARIHLLSHSPHDDHCPTDHWLNQRE